MGVNHLADDTMCSEQAKFSGYPRRGTPPYFGLGENLWEEVREKIAIAKTVNGELSPSDRVQQELIFF